MNNNDSSVFSFDEALKYAEEVAIEHFKNFHFAMQTPQTKQILLDKVESHIKDNEQLVADFLPQFNYIDKQENIKNIVYQIASKFEISQLLHISDESIPFIDNKFYVNGVSNYGQLNVNTATIQHCLKYPLRLNNFKIIDSITEVFKIQADLSFENCKFLGKINLYKNESIEYTIEMKNCIFYKEVTMSNKTFKGNVYFNNSIFADYTDFHESKFSQTACFYGVTFEKIPNFSQTIFGKNLNFINSNLNFNFQQCENVVNNELQRRNKIDSKVNTNNTLEKVANDFRDSFRGFKSALIKDNNLLDASNYHKIELYFKEIELKTKEPLKFSKEWVDLWQLKLYRLTSNHHTDLPKIFSFLIILIGIFATILFVRENLNILLEVKVIRGILGVAFIVYLIYTYETITSFNFFTLLSYIPCFWLLGDNPKYIFGVASLFANESCNGVCLILYFQSIRFYLYC